MYIVIIIYKNESLGYDLRVVAGLENFWPSGGGCTVGHLTGRYQIENLNAFWCVTV